MQKWEYVTVKLEAFGFNNAYVAARVANDREINNWKQTSLAEFINELGEKGWEMCGTSSPAHSSDTRYLFFKRLKP